VSALGLGMIVFSLLRKRDILRVSLVFFLVGSFLIIGEFIILTVFDAYAYKPGLFRDYFADDIAGYLLGNYFVWTGSAILVVTFSLGNRWIFLLSGVLMLIETVFLYLGIYEQHWWRTYFTGIIVILSLNLIKWWIAALDKWPYNFLRYITLYLIALIFIHLPSHLMLLIGKEHYIIGLVENLYRDSILFVLPYHAVMTFFSIYFVCVLQKGIWNYAPIPLFLLSDFIITKLNILIFQDHWNLLYLIICRAVILFCFILYKRYVCKKLPVY
jgi:hypothetical protein